MNDAKPQWVVNRVKARAEKFKRPTIACLGLAYKQDVDDLRESPAVEVVRQLVAADIGDVLVCEPNIDSHPEFTLADLNKALERADIIVILVDHRPFRKIKTRDLQEKVIIDTKGMLP